MLKTLPDCSSVFGSVFDNLGRLAKRETRVEFWYGGRFYSKVYIPFSRVYISPLLFRSFICKCCSRCCPPMKTIPYFLCYTKKQFEAFEEIARKKSILFEVEILDIKVNAARWVLYIVDSSSSTEKRCKFLNGDGQCSIHLVKPVHCALPPIHIDVMRGNVYLTKRLLRRNWLRNCLMEFTSFDFVQFRDWDLRWLSVLKEMAQDMMFTTWLDEIVNVFALMDNSSLSLPKQRLLVNPKEFFNEWK